MNTNTPVRLPKLNLSQRLKGGPWQIQFSLDGKSVRASTGETDKAKAMAAANAYLLQYIRSNEVDNFSPVSATAALLFSRFIRQKEADETNKSTLNNYRLYQLRFFKFFPETVKLSELTDTHFEEWKAWLLKEHSEKRGKPLAKKTVFEHLCFVSSVFKRFKLPNPIREIALPRQTNLEKQEQLKFHRRHQVRAFLEQAQAWKVANAFKGAESFFYLMVLAYNSGMRLGELKGIRFQDLGTDGSVYVRASKTDTGRRLALAEADEELSDAQGALWQLVRIAEEHYGEGRKLDSPLYIFSRDFIYDHYRECCKAAKVPILSPHASRHSWATRALRNGEPLAKVAKTLGHKSAETCYRIYFSFIVEEKPNSISW